MVCDLTRAKKVCKASANRCSMTKAKSVVGSLGRTITKQVNKNFCYVSGRYSQARHFSLVSRNKEEKAHSNGLRSTVVRGVPGHQMDHKDHVALALSILCIYLHHSFYGFWNVTMHFLSSLGLLAAGLGRALQNSTALGKELCVALQTVHKLKGILLLATVGNGSQLFAARCEVSLRNHEMRLWACSV